MNEYKDIIDYVPAFVGILSSAGLYAIAVIKGTIDFDHGKDTIFSRAIIPK